MPTRSLSRPIEVLLVEDSVSDKIIAVEALERAKVRNNLHWISDGEDAMAFLRHEGKYVQAPRPDLILLDLNLPRKNGREILKEVKSDPRFNLIPVVVMTAASDPEGISEIYRLHANCYISKPLEFKQLAEIVQSIENFWFQVVTLPPTPFLSAAKTPARSNLIEPPRTYREDATLRVLFIEDSPTDELIVRAILEDIEAVHFEVTHVQRMSNAIQLLDERTFDVALTDLGLPDSQGINTYRLLHAAAPLLPIIVFTSQDDEETGLLAMKEGAQDFLNKGGISGSLLSRSLRYAVERARLEIQLRQSQRMDAIGQLAGGIAHDFNNLITVILGHGENLATDLSLNETQIESAKVILEASQRAASLTRQLLTFSRRQIVQLKPVDLNDVIGRITKILIRVLGADIGLQLELATTLPPIHGDVGMLEQIVMNLVVNARDAMPGGGKLVIQTKVVDIKEETVSSDQQLISGPFVVLSVRDTGHGIPPEVLPHIFEPFFTTKEVGKGTGLGMATVYGAVKQHQGFIRIASQPNHGTEVIIFLPYQLQGEIVLPKAGPKQQRLSGSETILFVEDEQPLRELAKIILKDRNGYNVLEAADGNEALGIWAEKSNEIDIVVTDMVMPGGLSGLDLINYFKSQKPTIKTVATSGYSMDLLESKNLSGDVGAFIAKPYTPFELLKVVRDTLDGKSSMGSVGQVN